MPDVRPQVNFQMSAFASTWVVNGGAEKHILKPVAESQPAKPSKRSLASFVGITSGDSSEVEIGTVVAQIRSAESV
jgi:hypothetical protein